MAQSNTGTVAVVGSGITTGVFTEPDIARFLEDGIYDAKPNLGKMVSKRLDMVSPKTELSIAFDMMDTRKSGHLPPAEGNRLVGIISARDLMRYMAGIGTRRVAKYIEISERTIPTANDMQIENYYKDRD